jgi:hypothetical protein
MVHIPHESALAHNRKCIALGMQQVRGRSGNLSETKSSGAELHNNNMRVCMPLAGRQESRA